MRAVTFDWTVWSSSAARVMTPRRATASKKRRSADSTDISKSDGPHHLFSFLKLGKPRYPCTSSGMIQRTSWRLRASLQLPSGLYHAVIFRSLRTEGEDGYAG